MCSAPCGGRRTCENAHRRATRRGRDEDMIRGDSLESRLYSGSPRRNRAFPRAGSRGPELRVVVLVDAGLGHLLEPRRHAAVPRRARGARKKRVDGRGRAAQQPVALRGRRAARELQRLVAVPPPRRSEQPVVFGGRRRAGTFFAEPRQRAREAREPAARRHRRRWRLRRMRRRRRRPALWRALMRRERRKRHLLPRLPRRRFVPRRRGAGGGGVRGGLRARLRRPSRRGGGPAARGRAAQALLGGLAPRREALGLLQEPDVAAAFFRAPQQRPRVLQQNATKFPVRHARDDRQAVAEHDPAAQARVGVGDRVQAPED
mmetsp:Transcript_22379/g.69117  ORF Transcript_22379/g.69117 Transcript_22379/m.69117 type:complete len:318 (-) Transcript_22379:1146-2099(-)